ncbi:MAG: hypothetical protein JWQ09_2654 [Segetibacter sp.]|nr:hypothetical protein [Segetibacter sp.]
MPILPTNEMRRNDRLCENLPLIHIVSDTYGEKIFVPLGVSCRGPQRVCSAGSHANPPRYVDEDPASTKEV